MDSRKAIPAQNLLAPWINLIQQESSEQKVEAKPDQDYIQALYRDILPPLLYASWDKSTTIEHSIEASLTFLEESSSPAVLANQCEMIWQFVLGYALRCGATLEQIAEKMQAIYKKYPFLERAADDKSMLSSERIKEQAQCLVNDYIAKPKVFFVKETEIDAILRLNQQLIDADAATFLLKKCWPEITTEKNNSVEFITLLLERGANFAAISQTDSIATLLHPFVTLLETAQQTTKKKPLGDIAYLCGLIADRLAEDKKAEGFYKAASKCGNFKKDIAVIREGIEKLKLKPNSNISQPFTHEQLQANNVKIFNELYEKYATAKSNGAQPEQLLTQEEAQLLATLGTSFQSSSKFRFFPGKDPASFRTTAVDVLREDFKIPQSHKPKT